MDDLPTPLLADDAERAVLGGLILDASLLPSLGSLTAADFYRPHHATIFAAVREAVDSGNRVDALVVAEVLRSHGELTKVGGAPFLHDCASAIPTVANVGYYARLVQAAAKRRKLHEHSQRLRQAALAPDLDDALDLAAQVNLDVSQAVDTDTADDVTREVVELGAFTSETAKPYDWVIPGLLERMDRVMIVASEGAGKSTWMRQVATMLGQGLHPLNPSLRIPPQRCLIVDLENPPANIRRKSRALVSTVAAYGEWASDRVFLWSRPGGVNIRRSADAALLDRVVAHVRPALVCLGPMYKAALASGDRGEQVAIETAAALDRIRERYGVALWLEHHAPMAQNGHRELRPIESGLWARWVEFGIALRRDGQDKRTFRLERFKGDRDERCWPDSLTWGRQWPFEPRWDEGMPGGLHDGNWNQGAA